MVHEPHPPICSIKLSVKLSYKIDNVGGVSGETLSTHPVKFDVSK